LNQLDFNGIATQLGAGLGLDVKKIIKGSDQVQAEQEQAQAQQMAQQITPEMVKQEMAQGDQNGEG
jgi:hypothetical protein